MDKKLPNLCQKRRHLDSICDRFYERSWKDIVIKCLAICSCTSCYIPVVTLTHNVHKYTYIIKPTHTNTHILDCTYIYISRTLATIANYVILLFLLHKRVRPMLIVTLFVTHTLRNTYSLFKPLVQHCADQLFTTVHMTNCNNTYINNNMSCLYVSTHSIQSK